MSAGEVVHCAHCGGRGKCDCHGCNMSAGLGSDNWSVQCSSCGGAGKVWVGPNSGDDDYDEDEDEDDG